MVRAIVSFEAGHKGECLEEVKRVVLHQRRLTRLFHESIQEERVSRTVWLSYVQGFQGWGAGRVIDGDFVQFNGVSGNHVLVFQALDAFLGLDRYLADEDMERYIPANQRHFCAALKEASLRSRVQLGYGGDDKLDAMIESEMGKLAQQMRVSGGPARPQGHAYSQFYAGISSRPPDARYALFGAACARASHHDGWKVGAGKAGFQCRPQRRTEASG